MDYQPKTLRVLRAQYGYPQKMMADKLGISISQYCKIENGDKPLYVGHLVKLAGIFRLTPWELLEDLMRHDGNAHSFFRGKAAAEACKAPYDADADGEELAYLRKLASHYEDKYMKLFSVILDKSHEVDPGH